MTARIAIVDDEPLLREVVTEYLRDHGFDPLPLDGGKALRREFTGQQPDLVLLDVVMPDEDGLAVLRWLRGVSDVPVIMLTGEGHTTDRVAGLELGADDYVTKPCDMRELLARIRSVLRRRQGMLAAGGGRTAAPYDPANAWFGRWRLDRVRRRLVDSAGEVLEITVADFALLSVFADHPGVVLSRDKLLELSGTDPGEVFDRAIDLRITRLRKKVEPVPGDPTVIRTVRGHGGGYEYLPGGGPNYGR
jgi:DNA-binding response OmpR family regulator